MMKREDLHINRRDFLKTGTFAAAAAGIRSDSLEISGKKKKESDKNKILNYNAGMKYRRFGKSDIFFSILSLGGGNVNSSIAQYAIEHGVNLVHISSNYKGGRSIKELGKVLKKERDKVYIALKASFDDIDDVLKQLHSEYVDFLMFNRHKKTDINDPKDLETFEKYKKQGKVRFAGLTCHNEVKECVSEGIKGSMYSLIMPVLNQPNLEALNEDLKEAQKKGIGIMAMKVFKGIEKSDLQLAYLKKIVKNLCVTTITRGITTFEQFDSDLKAIQEALTIKEDISLYRYAQKNRPNNCMMCGECEHVCPKQIPISTLLRCKDYYFEQLHDTETAFDVYLSIPERIRNFTCHLNCRKCEEVCPNGIHIVDRLDKCSRIFRVS
jgi:predicted aldo/keto reductase-like oxidoreductase